MVCFAHSRIPVNTETSHANEEAVVKNPLSPTEHPGGFGVNCEMFELGVEQFVVGTRRLAQDNVTDSDVERISSKLNHHSGVQSILAGSTRLSCDPC